MSQGNEFEFLDDESGGRFVRAGGPVGQLRELLARQDIDAAVRVYEESNGAAREPVLEEAKMASFETRKIIGQMLKRARDFVTAAEVFELSKLESDAAQCFEAGGDYVRAGVSWRRLGDLTKAASCFQRAGRLEDALELYRQAGSQEGLAECLAKAGRFVDAAQIYRGLKNVHAEFEVLKQGISTDSTNVGCAVRLAEMLVHFQKAAVAVEMLTDVARRLPDSRTNVILLDGLARAYEANGAAEHAAKLRTHLATLPKPAGQMSATAPAGPPPAGAAPIGDVSDAAYGFLKALPLFAELTLTDLKTLFRACSRVNYAPGQNLIDAGQPGRGLFVVVNGQVEVYAGQEPNARRLNTLGVGGYVGEISLVQDGPTSARVTARTDVTALFISRDSFTQYLNSSPNAALCIWKLFSLNLADRVRALSAAR